ncbi:hypothetical protein GCM10025866_10410 [Naasia aerilata]|uniref:Uncharacterized protein n=1 Tax=Naasia aerilata TaxID=1162966 RepID=A0ABM8GA96_9MICO|nr:hypothetical protein GCM10025866_10410 [Naasia aerilata]
MPERPHKGVAERVPVGNVALRRHPEDLAVERSRVLGDVPEGCVTDSRVEHAVGTEGEASAVVVAGLRDPVEQHRLRPEAEAARCAREWHPHDPVVVLGGVVGVQPALAAVVEQGQAEQTAFAARDDALDAPDLARSASRCRLHDGGGVAQADQDRPVDGQDGPGRLESGDEVGRVAGRLHGSRRSGGGGAGGVGSRRGRRGKRHGRPDRLAASARAAAQRREQDDRRGAFESLLEPHPGTVSPLPNQIKEIRFRTGLDPRHPSP